VLPLYSRTVLVLYHPPTSYIALVPAGAVTEGPACSISDHSPEVTRSLCMADIFSKKEVWQTCLNSFFLCICIIYAWLFIKKNLCMACHTNRRAIINYTG
jgi:hypothetical protein